MLRIDEEGTRRWYNDVGQPHREDGPAIEFADGAKEWYVGGKRHRVGGPAVEYANRIKEWWVNGKRYKIEW